MSRKHMEIEHVDDAWVIRELSPSNGTYVNKERIGVDHHLADGDEIKIGRTRLRFWTTDPGPAHWEGDVYFPSADGLTGTFTQRFFLTQQAIDAGGPVALAMLDIASFRDVNDQHGFSVGDAVLKDFGQFLIETVGQSAEVGRTNNEAFCVWLKGDLHAINELAWAALKLVHGSNLTRPNGLFMA